ncbi:MAG: PH domain-containing protein [Nitrososphaerales archaeon]|nr:PH domain-containing protein [Nitrososphaerales archaeon]
MEVSISGMIWFWIGIIFFLIAFFRVYSTEYVLTNQRVYSKYGLISRKTSEARYKWITDVQVQQAFLSRTMNLGSIRINTPGSNITEVNFFDVSDPMTIKQRITNLSGRMKEADKIIQKLRRMEEEYELGRIDRAKYDELESKYRQQLSNYQVTPPPRKVIVEPKAQPLKENSETEFCAKCGEKIAKSDTFCRRCGNKRTNT